FYHDARSLALGGVSIVLEHPSNPATMGFIDDRRLLASGWFTIQNERRGLRVYDSFGNNIGIRTVTNNTSTNVSVGPSTVVIPFKMLRFGLQYTPVWDYNYYYRYEQRDDFYQLIRIDEQEYRGIVFALSPLFAFKYSFVSIGIEYSFLRGTWIKENKVIIPQLADSIDQEETELNGNKAKVGVVFAPSPNFRFSYVYQIKHDLDDVGFTYPNVHSLAIMYQPPGRIPTKFLAQVDFEMWGPIIFGTVVDEYPIVIYKVGVEHMILGRYALRYGFCIFPDYEQRAVWTTNLTLGFGASVGRYFFDIGYGYGKRDYLNSDFPTFDVGTNYMFDETTHNLLISTGVSF
ncbi:MAG: hypothetical protein WBE28_00590, partial [bacterium]